MYIYRLLYKNLMLTANQKSITDIYTKKKWNSKDNTTDSHQITREENKKEGGAYRNKFKTINKSVDLRQVNLEPVIQTEASKKEKDRYHVLTHIYAIQKNGSHEPICRAGVEMQTYGHSRERREWEESRVALKYIHYCM